MIEVVNLKRVQLPAGADEAVVVYVGRKMPGRRQSPLANLYELEKGMTRGACLEQYIQWLRARKQNPNSPARKELLRLAEIARERHLLLACWCAPAICHGDVIKMEIETGLETHVEEVRLTRHIRIPAFLPPADPE